MMKLQNILLPTDFSEPALVATRYAVQLARQFDATLHLLHVIEDPVVYLPIFESYPLPTRQQFETYAQDRLENWVFDDDRETIDVECHWRHGRPVGEIIRVAHELEADLIVLGTHGRGFAAHMLLGNVAEKVVRKAPCTVLTIKPDNFQYQPVPVS